jgi:hypothetical protein
MIYTEAKDGANSVTSISSSDIIEPLVQNFAMDVVGGQNRTHPETPNLAIIPTTSTDSTSTSTRPTVRNQRLCDVERLD